MKTTKVRELGAAELQDEARKASEQLFRLRFQLKLGQNEGVKRLQVLKKDVARIKTIERERALGIRGAATPEAGAGAQHKAGKVKVAKVAKADKAKAPRAAKADKAEKSRTVKVESSAKEAS